MEQQIIEYLYNKTEVGYINLTDFIFGLFKKEENSDYEYIVSTISEMHKTKLIQVRNGEFAYLGTNKKIPGSSPIKHDDINHDEDNEDDDFDDEKKYSRAKVEYPEEFIDFATFKKRNYKIEARLTFNALTIEREKKLTEQVNETNRIARMANESAITTNESLRATNDSVQELNSETERYYGQQKLFAIVSMVIAVLTTLFIALQFFKDDSKAQRLLHKQLIQITQIQDSMLRSQKGIDSSFRKAVKDSFYQRRK
jgi:hypothetical protein